MLILATLVASCGGAGSGGGASPGAGASSGATSPTSDFEIKIDGKVVPLKIESGWQAASDYSEYSTPGGKPTLTTGLQVFALRNYEYDPKKNYGAIKLDNEKLTAPGQMRVVIILWDEKGTTDRKTPLKAATYASDHKDSMSLNAVTVQSFAEGKDQVNGLSFSGGTPNKGEVKITSVTNDTASGEIDVSGTSGGKDFSIKGKFTAKLFKP